MRPCCARVQRALYCHYYRKVLPLSGCGNVSGTGRPVFQFVRRVIECGWLIFTAVFPNSALSAAARKERLAPLPWLLLGPMSAPVKSPRLHATGPGRTKPSVLPSGRQ